MRNNIITANAGDKPYIKTGSVFQYDYGLILQITGITLPEEYDVHFGNDSSPSAKTVTGNASGVAVPDEYLRNGEDVHAWLYLHTGNNDGESVLHIQIPVIERAAIDTEEVTPIEHHFVEDALETMTWLAEQAEASVLNYPYVGENNNWMVWDANAGEYADSGVKAVGVDGRDGVDGQPGADGKDGKDGKDGQDGRDGRDGVDGQNGTNGRDGVDGQPGTDGKDGVDGKDGTDGKDGKDGQNADFFAVHNVIENTNPIVIHDGADGIAIDDMIIVVDPIQEGSGAAGPRNIRRVNGVSELTLTVASSDDTVTHAIDLGQTVYGCTIYPKLGKAYIDRVLITKNCANMNNTLWQPGWRDSGVRALVGAGVNQIFYGETLNVGTSYGIDTTGDNDILYLGYDQYGMRQTDWINTEINVQFCIRLPDPIEIQIEPIEISTEYGDNGFSVSTGRISYLKYICDTKLYIDHKFAELQALILDM